MKDLKQICHSSVFDLLETSMSIHFHFFHTKWQIEVIDLVKKRNETEVNEEIGKLEMLEMGQLQPLKKQVLVEKHLISPQLIEETRQGSCLLSENEVISIMVNEENH